MEVLTACAPLLQADSPDAKDELACLEVEHQKTLREVSGEERRGSQSLCPSVWMSLRLESETSLCQKHTQRKCHITSPKNPFSLKKTP